MRGSLTERLMHGVDRIRSYLSARALILLYHRVSETGSDPWQLAVTPAHLDEHFQVLSNHGRVMSLRKLSAALDEGMLPRRRVVVTFDDGYADNLLNAKPLLEKYDIPATVFITTGYTGEGREFWWDELDRLFLQPGELPGTLGLRVNGTDKQWKLGTTALYDESSHRRQRLWRAWQDGEAGPRQSVYRSLWELMHPMPEEERLSVRDKLLAWAGASGLARETHRALAREEIIELARGGLIEIGCHTITHPQLSALSEESQRDEILQSKLKLQEILEEPVTGFAFPYGRRCDYTNETVALVPEAGFDYSCTTSAGVVDRRADRFQLPRIQVQDMDGESFARLVSEWLLD